MRPVVGRPPETSALVGTRSHELLLTVLLGALFALKAAHLDSLRLGLGLPRHIERQEPVVEAGLDVVALHVRRKSDLPLVVAENHLAADVGAFLLALVLLVGGLDAEDTIRERDLYFLGLEAGDRRLDLVSLLRLLDVEWESKRRRFHAACFHALEDLAEPPVHRVVQTGQLADWTPACQCHT